MTGSDYQRVVERSFMAEKVTNHIARHYLKITLEAGDGIMSQLICTGNEESDCWQSTPEYGGKSEPYGTCIFAEWHDITENIVTGEVQVEIEEYRWVDDQPEMQIKEDEEHRE